MLTGLSCTRRASCSSDPAARTSDLSCLTSSAELRGAASGAWAAWRAEDRLPTADGLRNAAADSIATQRYLPTSWRCEQGARVRVAGGGLLKLEWRLAAPALNPGLRSIAGAEHNDRTDGARGAIAIDCACRAHAARPVHTSHLGGTNFVSCQCAQNVSSVKSRQPDAAIRGNLVQAEEQEECDRRNRGPWRCARATRHP
jgi:hypothetical protein